jgi:metallo-beta-lactamase family protein
VTSPPRSSPSPSLSFLGAVRTVTGSRFLVEHRADRLLVDAGLFQGLPELRRRNWDPPAMRPGELDGIVLTHAHLDHSGYLPRLVRDGFAGPVLCSADTAALTEIVLRDSAHLQAEDARLANQYGWSRHHPALPLYDTTEVEKTLPLLRGIGYGEPTRIGDTVIVTLQPAGHILGSAVAVLEVEDHRVAFSGDLGRPGHPLLLPPPSPPSVDTLVLESTYGDRRHPDADPEVLAAAIRRTAARGGVVLLPAFAVDRTELVILELRRLMEEGRIPRLPVFIDSPMALKALGVYQRALRDASPQLRPGRASALEGLERVNIHRVADAAGSERLNEPTEPCIIISASGMATGGRVVHHLVHQLPDPRNTVVLTGYQAEGTRGRQLANGATHVKLHGRYLAVRAEVVEVPDFSVHADADELVAWVASAPEPPRTVYVVHGEGSSSDALAHRLEKELGVCAVVPRLGERVRLV